MYLGVSILPIFGVNTNKIASDSNYKKYEHLLSEGWIPGHKIVSEVFVTLFLADPVGRFRRAIWYISREYTLSRRPPNRSSTPSTTLRKLLDHTHKNRQGAEAE